LIVAAKGGDGGRRSGKIFPNPNGGPARRAKAAPSPPENNHTIAAPAYRSRQEFP
jgi:hypothetical protein